MPNRVVRTVIHFTFALYISYGFIPLFMMSKIDADHWNRIYCTSPRLHFQSWVNIRRRETISFSPRIYDSLLISRSSFTFCMKCESCWNKWEVKVSYLIMKSALDVNNKYHRSPTLLSRGRLGRMIKCYSLLRIGYVTIAIIIQRQEATHYFGLNSTVYT